MNGDVWRLAHAHEKMYIRINENKGNVKVLKYTKELVRNKCDVYINTHAHVEDIGVSVKVRGVLMYLFNHSLHQGKISPLKREK